MTGKNQINYDWEPTEACTSNVKQNRMERELKENKYILNMTESS